jgi:uncharacterized ion transporter superfamily protein YfcC
MSLEMKLLLALAPVCLAGMIYALTQGDWWNAGMFAFLMFLTVVIYRNEKRLQR